MARARDKAIGPSTAALVERDKPLAASIAGDDAYDARGTFTVALAHFAHDLYPSMIGVLVPVVQAKLGISLALASLMVPAQQMPSILQPVVGVLADRTSRRWFVVIAPGTAAVSLSLVGLAPHVSVVLLLLLCAGLSSAAFHAPAVALIGEFGGERTGRAMSIFMAMADLARTLGPLIMTATIALLTLEGAAVVMVFGLAASVFLYFNLDTSHSDAARHAAPKLDLRPIFRARRKQIGALIGYTMINAVSLVPFQYFLVKLLVNKGYGDWYGGIALTVLSAAGVAGGLIAGNMADHVGARRTLLITALLTTPLFYLYLWFEDGSWLMMIPLAVAGLVAWAPRPVSLAVAQNLMPEARGPIAGLMLAVSFVAISIGALAFGALGDTIGVERAFWYTSVASLLGIPFIMLLPGKTHEPTHEPTR